MTFKLIKNTKKHNKGKDINNDLKDLSCQRKTTHVVILTIVYLLTKAIFFEIVMLHEKDNFVDKFTKEK
jgi:hypothetical protein